MRDPNRIRIKGKFDPYYCLERHIPHRVFVGSPWTAYVVPIPEIYQIMRDTHGFRQNAFNPCYHVNVATTLKPLSFVPAWSYWDSEGWVNTWSIQASKPIYFPMIEEGVKNLPLGLDTWLDDFSAKAENHFVTAVKPTVSIVNFILELVDILELDVNAIRKAADAFLKALRTFFGMIRKGANYWVAWNFAIKPTIKDLQAIRDMLKTAKKRYEWLKARNHKVTRVKYREGPRLMTGVDFIPILGPALKFIPGGDEIPLEEVQIETGWFESGNYELQQLSPTNNLVRCEMRWNATVTLSAQADVRFDIDDVLLSDETFGIAAVTAAINGLYRPVDIIWEATPFSWLVDWFLSEKQRLKKLAADLSPFKDGQILQTGHSIKLEVSGDLRWVDGRGIELSSYMPFSTELYIRQPGLPEVDTSPFRVPFKWYNASILIGIIIGKRN